MQRLFPTTFAAFSFSFFPKYKLKFEAPPTPIIIESEAMMVTSGKATFVAALPNVPTLWPIKI